MQLSCLFYSVLYVVFLIYNFVLFVLYFDKEYYSKILCPVFVSPKHMVKVYMYQYYNFWFSSPSALSLGFVWDIGDMSLELEKEHIVWSNCFVNNVLAWNEVYNCDYVFFEDWPIFRVT